MDVAIDLGREAAVIFDGRRREWYISCASKEAVPYRPCNFAVGAGRNMYMRNALGKNCMISDSAQLQRLEDHCRSLGKLAVAFSGGLDSRFLLYAANRAGTAVRALHIRGPHIPRRETEEALQWAEEQKIPCTLILMNPLQNPAVRANGPERCYHCKHAAFSLLMAGIQEGEALCDGTNVSDFTGYRPGLRALRELGVTSPLAKAGLSKQDIQHLARQTGMDRPEQKARPCLFTRYAYGLEPNEDTLAALDAAERQIEAFLSSESKHGSSPPFRLRLTGEGPVVHIQSQELSQERKNILDLLLLEHGFHGARVETLERISGYFDRQEGFN